MKSIYRYNLSKEINLEGKICIDDKYVEYLKRESLPVRICKVVSSEIYENYGEIIEMRFENLTKITSDPQVVKTFEEYNLGSDFNPFEQWVCVDDILDQNYDFDSYEEYEEEEEGWSFKEGTLKEYIDFMVGSN